MTILVQCKCADLNRLPSTENTDSEQGGNSATIPVHASTYGAAQQRGESPLHESDGGDGQARPLLITLAEGPLHTTAWVKHGPLVLVYAMVTETNGAVLV